MNLRALLALAGLTLGFSIPAFAQQKEPLLSEQDREQILAIGKKNDEAWSKGDAAALAALFTEDGVMVTPGGILSGREAIQQRDQSVFDNLRKRLGTEASEGSAHITNVTKVVEMHAIDDHTAWGAGEWTQTIPGPNHTVREAHGYWGCVTVRDGDIWKNRMLTVNVITSPAASGTATPSPTTTPGNQ